MDIHGVARKYSWRAQPRPDFLWIQRPSYGGRSWVQWVIENECSSCKIGVFEFRQERCDTCDLFMIGWVVPAPPRTLLDPPPPPLLSVCPASLLLTGSAPVSKGEKPASMVKRTTAHGHISAVFPSYLGHSTTSLSRAHGWAVYIGQRPFVFKLHRPSESHTPGSSIPWALCWKYSISYFP